MNFRVITFRFIFTLFCIFSLQFASKAQIEPIKVGTTTRNMLVYAPPGIEKNRPLLLSLHGLNQDINYQQNQTQWETVAKANNFVVVYPAGINNSWDLNGKSDTDFILAIINEMYNRYGIDRKRVYLSGFSMGGMMTYHAANVIADKIAAFAPVSGYLMSGPNTNSSRPIPIIHTHGTGDPVVAYSGVKTCLDAWISRNGCPKTAKVTKPYPAGKTASNATKYYWGPGKDNVQIVLLSLAGVGHWHSIDPNGVNTSQEIWDFCKNFSLGFGVSEFRYASVTESDPKQIQVSFSGPLKKLTEFNGFTVKVDGQIAAIDSVVLADSTRLMVNLADSILKDNEISLSYSNGNVVSVYDKKLANFTDTLVENLLNGASPRIIEVSSNKNGDTLIAKFNMKMLKPADVSAFTLKGEFNGDISIPISRGVFLNNDSTKFFFPLEKQVYADYKLLFTYSGNNVASANGGFLKQMFDLQVINNSTGLPVHINSGKLQADGFTILLDFSKSMKMEANQLTQFVLKVNDKATALKELFVTNKTIQIKPSNSIHFGDVISLSYTPGSVTAADKGALDRFSDFAIENQVNAPVWQNSPGKVEAENYTFQSGVQTENTSDTGGGLNVGWIETGDWLEYAIENSSSKADYQITFRVSSPNTGGVISYSIDKVNAGKINVPNTGNWQVFQSVTNDITLTQGKHYLKLLASTGGFNINYFEIKEKSTGTGSLSVGDIHFYPNPVTNQIIIQSDDLQYNKVDVVDMLGKTVLSKSIVYKPELCMPVSLPNGTYLVKISNETQSRLLKIIVKND